MAGGPSHEHFSEENSAETVAASFAETPDPRLREIMTSLVRHLHGFIKDVELTEAEWATAIDFLTATGQKSDEVRQEFILLSDVLGASMLIETINNRAHAGGTESTVLGPFHMVRSPPRPQYANIAVDGKGEACLVSVQVTRTDGTAVEGASVDVWHANAEGFYDVQQPGIQPERNLRGLFTADSSGLVLFQTIMPRHYPIPVDGPVGALLAATGRHPNRPAHIHVLITAPGFRPLTTHIFVKDSPYINSDAVFAVKDSLIHDFALQDDAELAESLGLPNPYRFVHFQAVLQPDGPE